MYAAAHMPTFIGQSEPYLTGNLNEALKKAFLDLDRNVLTEEAVVELQGLCKGEFESQEAC